MNRRDFLETLALSGVGMLARPGSARACGGRDADPTVGINTNTYHWREPENLEHLRELGIRHVRVTGILQFWEGEVPSYRAYLRESAELAAQNGVLLTWVLHNSRGEVFWTGAERQWWERMASFAAWCARLPAVEAVQLWNEPDVWVQAPFGSGQRPRLPAEEVGRNYARFLRFAYPRVKRAGPGVLVVSGGTADHPDGRWKGFLSGMLETEPPVDAIGVHAYGVWGRARGIVEEAKRAVDGSAPLWVTECGNDRPERPDPAYQLECWSSVLEGNDRERLAQRIYPYTLPTDPADPGHGLFHPSGRPRPAFGWLKSWMDRRSSSSRERRPAARSR